MLNFVCESCSVDCETMKDYQKIVSDHVDKLNYKQLCNSVVGKYL